MDENEIQDVDDLLTAEDRPSSGIPWGGIFLALWMASLLVFSIQNAEDVTVEFLGLDVTIPLAAVVLITALVTFFVTAAVLWFRRRRRAKEDGQPAARA